MRLSAKQGSGTAWSTVQTVNLQVHGGVQSPLPPLWNSFVGTGIHNGPVPPALKLERERTKEEKEKEVLHLFRCYTHTPGRSRVNPERQEEEKRRTHDGQTAKNSAGGEGNRRTSGTNLHGETDLTQNSAHT